LEVVPEVCDTNGTYEHVKYRRQGWYGCACCPPNIARTIASVGDYAYRVDGNALYVDVFAGGTVDARLDAGTLSLSQTGDYPWEERLRFEVTSAPAGAGAPADSSGSTGVADPGDPPGPAAPVEICVRIPGWCEQPSMTLNGERVNVHENLRNGYLVLSRSWRDGDTLELTLPMPVRLVGAHPKVRANYGRVAVQRGPLVYCLEECDNGADLHSVSLSTDPQFTVSDNEELPNGVRTITARGYTVARTASRGPLYRDDGPEGALYRDGSASPTLREKTLTFIPYYCWANREAGEMIVWIRRHAVTE
ncbi:MAG: hypothetical protein ACOCRN_03845, partial [Spirochaetia bacterium]